MKKVVFTTDPDIVAAGIAAFERYGSGCSGSRFLNGTLSLHLELERELAAFLRKDAVVTFSTGFQSNLGIISALVGRNDYVLCDRENHASIYDGCKLSYGKMLRYRHNDMVDLERQLQKVPESAGKLIVTDGVFSMGGDIAKLPEIVALAKALSLIHICGASFFSLRIVLLIVEFVAYAPKRDDPAGLIGGVLNLLTQVPDVDIHRPGVAVIVQPPNLIRWNCKCTLSSTDEAPTAVPDENGQNKA